MMAPVIEARVPLSVNPDSLENSARTQTAETASSSPSGSAISQWSSLEFSRSAPWPGAEETQVRNTGAPGAGLSSSGMAAGGRAQTTGGHATPAVRSTGQNQAAHEATTSSSGDASDVASSQALTAVSSSQARGAGPHPEHAAQTIADTSGNLTQYSVMKSDHLTHPATLTNALPSREPLAPASAEVQTGSAAVQDASKPLNDRIVSHAANHNPPGEMSSSAAQIGAVQAATVDAAAPVGLRGPAAPHVPVASAANHQQIAAAVSTATPAQDAFSALDAGASLGTPAWVHAGGQHAEAGFRDPALGWVGVRADLNASGIHATLVPSSAEAAQALNSHIAGLSTHLEEQQTPVASLSMASPDDGGVANGSGQRMQQGAESNPQGSAPEGSQTGSQEKTTPDSSASALTAPAQGGIPDALTQTGELRGTHISVMA